MMNGSFQVAKGSGPLAVDAVAIQFGFCIWKSPGSSGAWYRVLMSRRQRGPVGVWQRYEEATMCQRRPADPTDPGDAADLSIMGYF